jgi:pantoate--beta-alanine ligase
VTEIVASKQELRGRLSEWRLRGESIGLVPTMGALHDGHVSLLRAARERCDRTVVSIFVNPLQFGAGEDFTRYPRDLGRDRDLLAAAGCDLVFAPDVGAMYAPRATTRVVNAALAARFEGEHRPGHFDGVLTVVAKLFNLVQPDVAFFGQKDAQQALLIRRLAVDLDFPLDVVVCPIVREADGLAMSSRNAYLDPLSRERAVALSRALAAARQRFADGERDAAALLGAARAVLDAAPGVTIEYLALVDPETLEDVSTVASDALLLLTARVAGTRLLDNAILAVGDAP